MTNLQRPSTSCQLQRPSLADDDQQMNNNNKGKNLLTRSYTFDGVQSVKQQQPQQQQQQQVQQRATKPSRSVSAVVQQQQQQGARLGRSLLRNDNWRQETMGDVRINGKGTEQSDQNILLGKGDN